MSLQVWQKGRERDPGPHPSCTYSFVWLIISKLYQRTIFPFLTNCAPSCLLKKKKNPSELIADRMVPHYWKQHQQHPRAVTSSSTSCKNDGLVPTFTHLLLGVYYYISKCFISHFHNSIQE